MQTSSASASARITRQVRARARHQRRRAGRAREGRAGDRAICRPRSLPPVITKVDPDADPIFSFAIGGPLPLRALTEIADKQIRRAIETVDGVGEVTISRRPGARDPRRSRPREAERARPDASTTSATPSWPTTSRCPAAASSRETPSSRCARSGRFESTDQFANIVVATQRRHADPAVATSPRSRTRGGRAHRRRSSTGSAPCRWTSAASPGQNTCRSSRRSSAKLDVAAAAAAAGRQDHRHARRLAASSTPRSPRSRST